MANHISALKRIRQNEKRRLRNRRVRQTMRTRIKQARAQLTQTNLNPEAVRKNLQVAISQIDKAASKGVIHKRAAARRVSRLTRQANKILASSL